MDAAVSISVGSILAVVGFIFQVGITVAAIAFSHGALNQRVRQIEEKLKEHNLLATSVTRLETEMEGVSREIKGLREDLRRARAEMQPQPRALRRSPYDVRVPREWLEEEEWST